MAVHIEDEIVSQVIATVSGIGARLTELVKEICKPLFMLFDFFEVRDETYSDIVDNFVRGRMV